MHELRAELNRHAKASRVFGGDATSGPGPGLEHQHAPTGACQTHGRGQPGHACAGHDDILHRSSGLDQTCFDAPGAALVQCAPEPGR